MEPLLELVESVVLPDEVAGPEVLEPPVPPRLLAPDEPPPLPMLPAPVEPVELLPEPLPEPLLISDEPLLPAPELPVSELPAPEDPDDPP